MVVLGSILDYIYDGYCKGVCGYRLPKYGIVLKEVLYCYRFGMEE